ncbi:MAG: tetratricopeptide repeat protein [bacterium]
MLNSTLRLFILLIALPFASSIAQTQNPAARYWFAVGVSKSSPEECRDAFTLALEYDSAFVEAQFHLARSLRLQNKLRAAEKQYRNAYLKSISRQLNDTLSVRILFELTDIYKQSGKWKECESVLRKAKAIERDSLLYNKILIELCKILYSQERYIDVLAELENSPNNRLTIDITENGVDFRTITRENAKKRITDLEMWIANKVDSKKQQEQSQHKIEMEFAAGLGAFQNANWEQATYFFQKTLELDENHREARNKLVNVRNAMKRKKADGLLAHFYTDLDALYERGQTLYRAGRWNECLEIFEKMQSIQPNYRDVAEMIRNIRMSHFQQSNASFQLPRSLPLFHFKAALYWISSCVFVIAALFFVLIIFSPSTRAYVYYKVGKVDLSASVYESLLEQNPGRLKLYIRLADIYLKLGRSDQFALDVFNTIFKLNIVTENRNRIRSILVKAHNNS